MDLSSLKPVSYTHLDVYKRQVTRYMQRQGQIWIRIFPDKPITKKPAEVRMGKGKGNPEGFVAPVTPGRIIFEADGVPVSYTHLGYALEALKITLIDGSFHPVDSDALSVEMAAKIGYKEAAQKAKPVLLEPIMKLEVVTPEDFMGDIIADLNRRRGQVESMDSRIGARVITAKVPLAEQFGYVTVLRTLSSGRASSSMEFDHYAEVPKNIAREVVEKANGRVDLI